MSAQRLIANRFVIKNLEQDLLGRGGMGDVYRATDTQTGEAVAVKVLNPDILEREPELLARFTREGEALRQLNHPNIVRLIAAVEEQGRHYLVMEYVEGGSLRERLAALGSLPAAEVVKIALEVADALTRTHHLGIIHRDLKPANVQLAKDGTPRLVDFGIAHLQDSTPLTQTGVLVGTVDYLSPEICQGDPPSELSDLWAFGVMLFEMLSGQLPFKGGNLTAKITSILTQPVPDLAALVTDIPEALEDLIYRMLEKDPQQRIPSVRLVGAELEALAKGRQVVTPSRPVSMEGRFATPTPSPQKAKHNLPVQPTAFVGRQAELTEIARLLKDPEVRLVSVVGAGGIGKTRLALEVGLMTLANEVGKDCRFAQGVYFVALAPLETSAAIVPTLASAVGFSFYEGGEPRQQLLDYVCDKSMLLILDNFEHLLSGVELVTEILSTAPQVKILSTSRVRLNVQSEQLFHIGGMDFPDWETPEDASEYSAVKLFLQSARRVQPDFALRTTSLKYITRICRLVAGMPLGIVLAAAWMGMLTPEEIAIETEKSLDFLESEQRDLPNRQHSLRAVFDHSWNLLTQREQEAFKRLSVFRGGFTREAAQAVTGASLRDLMGLVDKSILERNPAGRFGIHELLRQYAAERLGQISAQEAEARDQHCAYYSMFLHNRATQLSRKNQKRALDEIGAEVENVQTGWDRTLAQARIQDVGNSLESLAEFYRIRALYKKGEEACDKASQMLVEAQKKPFHAQSQLILGKAILWQGRFYKWLGLEEKSNDRLKESLLVFRELGVRREEALALCYLAGCDDQYGGSERKKCLEGLAISQEIDDKRGIALALRGLAWVALHEGDYPTSRQYFQDSLALSREVDDMEGIVGSLRGIGYVSWILGQFQEAKQYHQEMLELSTQHEDQGGIARALGDLAIDTYGFQEYEEAIRLWHKSLEIYEEIGNKDGMDDVLGDLGAGAIALGQYEQAAQFAKDSLSISQELHGYDRAWSLRVLGEAACGMGDLHLARTYFGRAIKQALVQKRKGYILLTVVDIAKVLKLEGETDRPLEFLAFILHHPASWQIARDWVAPLAAELESELPADRVGAARERGRARDLDTTVVELLNELGE
jgi:predicted ATPase